MFVLVVVIDVVVVIEGLPLVARDGVDGVVGVVRFHAQVAVCRVIHSMLHSSSWITVALCTHYLSHSNSLSHSPKLPDFIHWYNFYENQTQNIAHLNISDYM